MKRDLIKKKQGYEQNLKQLEEAQKDYVDIFRSSAAKKGSFGLNTTKGKDGVEQETNVGALLDTLRDKISTIYKKVKNDKSDLTAKGNVEMLSEIESLLDRKVTGLARMREADEKLVKTKENERKVKRKEEKLKNAQQKQAKDEIAKRERANKASQEKGSNEFKGRTLMARSKKKSIKKKKVEVKKDPQLEARKRYVGDID